MRLLVHAAIAVVMLALGAGTAVASVAVHELGWGFALAVSAPLVTLLALPPGWWSRLPFALGWTGGVAWLAGPRPEGDYVISSDWQGYALIGMALVVMVLGIATLPRPRGRRRERGRASPPAREPGTVGSGS